MNDQEREVIADIFRRLEQVADQPRDPEAERFISEKLRQQPYAPYAMAQAIFVQEQALTNLQAEVETLRAEVEEARRQPQASGGILSSLFGGGQRPQAEPYRQNAPEMTRQAAPWGGPSVPQRQPGYGEPGEPRGSGVSGPWGGAMGQARGGGFLQGALSTAAGVAGGMMVANALTSAFGGKQKAGLADTAAADATTDDASITNSLYENPAEEQPNDFDDFGGEGGDEGDWV
ncbi:MAG: hypothetical protein K0S56_4375 [Microvirga sp.]|nr:hypothetical protein [Microvirga sp.]